MDLNRHTVRRLCSGQQRLWAHFYRIYLIGIFILHLWPISAQSEPHIREQLEKIIRYDTKISYDEIPGFLVGIVDGDTSFIEAFGHANRLQTERLHSKSIFQVGGLTKVFTAMLAQVLHDRGIICLDTSINQYLPSDSRNHALDYLTIRHLLSHTSGLPLFPDNFATDQEPRNRYRRYTKKSLMNYYRDARVLAHHRGKYRHAHTNYALCELLLEFSTSTSYPELLQKYILSPLGMTTTACTDVFNSDGLTPGFDRSGQLAEPWHFSSFSGSEGLQTSMQDLCLFLRHMLSDEHTLSSSFQHLLQRHQKLPRSKKTYIATGWHFMQHRKKDPIYLHSGKTNGHAASIHFIKDTKTGVIVLTNSPGTLDGLALLTLRMINHNWKRNK